MPPRRRGPTAVEGLIILAIVGIVLSILSSPHTSPRMARPSARPAPRVSTEGRGNTIAPPDSRAGRSPEAFPAADRALRALARYALPVGAFLLLSILRRYQRRRRSPRRPPQHEHPPDAQE